MKQELLIINQKLQQLLTELSEIPVESAEDIQVWLHAYQLTRRYLTNNQRTLYIGRLYKLRKREKEQRLSIGQNARSDQTNSESVAAQFGINEKTVRRAEEVVDVYEKADPETKQRFVAGQLSKKLRSKKDVGDIAALNKFV